jgi:hypothetical protein
VSGWLVGERRRLAGRFARTVDWLRDADARDERFDDPPWHNKMSRKRALALAGWLAAGRDERKLWHAAAAIAADAVLAGDFDRTDFVQGNLADCLRDFLLAGTPGEGAQLADGLSDVPRTKWPDEAVFAVHCCGSQEGRPPADADAFLRRHLAEDWLGAGQFIRAAAWAKYLLASHGKAKPEAILLGVYDFMPGIQRPAARDGTTAGSGKPT